MNTNKKSLSRAYEEIIDNISNLLNARYEDYITRVNQLFNSFNNNDVLKVITTPFLEFNLEHEEFGFNNNRKGRVAFTIPTNEDKEIALILQLLYIMKDDETSTLNIPRSIYMHKNVNENLNLFNKNIIEPALRKLSKKFKYKIEDLTISQDEVIDLNKMTIINIENINANNSAIAVGSNIQQSYSKDKFNELKAAIEKIDHLGDKLSLLDAIRDMESKIDNKSDFKVAYNNFLTQLGSYVTIASPFLPYLASFL